MTGVHQQAGMVCRQHSTPASHGCSNRAGHNLGRIKQGLDKILRDAMGCRRHYGLQHLPTADAAVADAAGPAADQADSCSTDRTAI